MSRRNPVRTSNTSTTRRASQETIDVTTADPTAGDHSKAEAHQSTPPPTANFPAFGTPRVNSSPARSGPITMHTPPTAYLRSDGQRIKVERGGHGIAYGREEEDGGEQLFDNLIPPNANFAAMRAVGPIGNGVNLSPGNIPDGQILQDPFMRPPAKLLKLPPATKRSYRSSLYAVARTYVSVAAPEGYSPPVDSPSPPPPPQLSFESLPPDDPTLMAVQFDELELPPERRNPNGINWIVQSPEHGYLLMRHLEKQQRALQQRQSSDHQPPPHPPVGEGSAMESNNQPRELSSTQESNSPQHGQNVAPSVPQNTTSGPSSTSSDASPNRWPSAQDPSGSWSVQQSPVRSSVPQGWQMPYGQQSAGMAPPTGARAYQTPEGWTQSHPTSYTIHQPPSPSSPVQWQPSNGQPQPQHQQQSHPAPTGAPASGGPPSREGSWIQTERRPPSSAGSRWPTQPTAVPQGPPSQQWTPSMSNPPTSAVWQEHGHQPHPTIDGRADGMRWTEGVPNHVVTWDVMSTRGPGPSPVRPMSEAGGQVASAGFSIADAGRALNTRVRSVADGDNSAQQSPTGWTPSQNANPPWAPPEGRNQIPPDGRIQTPGGTGAMGGAVHSAPTPSSIHPPSTPTAHHHPAPSYGGPPMYSSYPAQIGPPPPGSMVGREMQPGSQPDSLGSYGQPSMGPPPPSAIGPGNTPGGYILHRTPSSGMEAGNPYPHVPPPPPGAAPYRTPTVPRPGMAIDANQNFYGSFHNVNTSQQATPMQMDPNPPNSYGGYATVNAPPGTYTMVPHQQMPPNPQTRRPTMGMNPYPNVGAQGIPSNSPEMYGSMMGMQYGAPPPPPQQ